MVQSATSNFHLFAALFVAVAAFVIAAGNRHVLPHSDNFSLFLEKNAHAYATKVVALTGNETSINPKLPLKGFTVVVTGCTSGIGKGITTITNRLGATVLCLGRNKKKLDGLSTEVCGAVRDHCNLITVVADNSDLDCISKAVDEIQAMGIEKIDFLINNAGIIYQGGTPYDSFATKQGYDMAFGVNYLSHFLLTEKLLPLLGKSQSPRVIQISSMYHRQPDGSDLVPRLKDEIEHASPIASQSNVSTFIHRTRAYGNSKLAQVFHARALSRRLKKRQGLAHVKILSVCPGWVATSMTNGAFMLGFPSDGIGLASTVNAMFRDDVGGENETDFLSNLQIPCLGSIHSLLAKTWMQGAFRDAFVWTFAFVLLPFNNFLYTELPTPLETASLESFDIEKQEALYDWSVKAVSQWV